MGSDKNGGRYFRSKYYPNIRFRLANIHFIKKNKKKKHAKKQTVLQTR